MNREGRKEAEIARKIDTGTKTDKKKKRRRE